MNKEIGGVSDGGFLRFWRANNGEIAISSPCSIYITRQNIENFVNRYQRYALFAHPNIKKKFILSIGDSIKFTLYIHGNSMINLFDHHHIP